MDSKRTSHLILIVLALAWCSLLFIPPLVVAFEAPSTQLSQLAYRFFSRICHQYPSRSLHAFGHPLAVCARCSAIYFGFLGGFFVAAFRSSGEPKRITAWLTFFLLPMFIDVILDGVGVHASSMFTRIFTGLIFGIGSGIILAPVFAEAVGLIVSKLSFRDNHVPLFGKHQHAKTG